MDLIIKNLILNDSAKLLLASKKTVTMKNIKFITPWLFKSPVAPTIAAKKEKKISYQKLKSWCLKRINSSISKFILFEGAGGVMVPIEKQKTFTDLFQHHQYSSYFSCRVLSRHSKSYFKCIR